MIDFYKYSDADNENSVSRTTDTDKLWPMKNINVTFTNTYNRQNIPTQNFFTTTNESSRYCRLHLPIPTTNIPKKHLRYCIVYNSLTDTLTKNDMLHLQY